MLAIYEKIYSHNYKSVKFYGIGPGLVLMWGECESKNQLLV